MSKLCTFARNIVRIAEIWRGRFRAEFARPQPSQGPQARRLPGIDRHDRAVGAGGDRHAGGGFCPLPLREAMPGCVIV